jgi:hypothetical protein
MFLAEMPGDKPMAPPEFLLEFKIKSNVWKAFLILRSFLIARQVSRHARTRVNIQIQFSIFFFYFWHRECKFKKRVYSSPPH